MNNWINIETMPESGKDVLIYYENELGKSRIVKAFYAGKYEIESSPEDEESDYSEEEDCYYYPVGWYETIDNWDDYANCLVQYEPTHWQPLPENPSKF